MKKNIYTFLGVLTVILAFQACSSTRDMQVLVTRPALFEIPSEISNILLINRSKGNANTIIEGIITGELPGRDQQLAERCMSGLMQTLMLNKTLSISRLEESLPSSRGASTGFGSTLPWEIVQEYANRYNADAVLVLEYFDSDFSTREVPELRRTDAVYMRGTAKADAGFRLYYPAEKSILYERSFDYWEDFTEFAATRELALAKLIKGPDALSRISFNTGQSFARRITPYRIWEDRLMFKGKKNEAMEKAERNVIANNWQEGVDMWLNAYKNATEDETKGRIAYNLALGYEVLGNFEEAKRWISTSFVEHANKKAQAYAAIINRRIEQEAILERQGVR